METGSLGSKSRAFPGPWARARLAIAPLAMGLLDVVLTVLGQPSEYWAGGKVAALESNPLARLLLEWHPLAFPIAAAVYLTLIGALVLRSRREVARVLALAFTLGHAFGASTWLLRLPWGIVYCVVLWVAARWLWGLGDEESFHCAAGWRNGDSPIFAAQTRVGGTSVTGLRKSGQSPRE